MSSMAETIESAVELMNEGDIDTFYELIADDCVLTAPHGELRGRQAILDGDRSAAVLMEPHYRRFDRPIVSGNDIAYWGVFGGTVKATGKSFEVEICGIFHTQDGKIVRQELYYDISKSASAWSS
jgi:ketosteroid isomerase-like protein